MLNLACLQSASSQISCTPPSELDGLTSLTDSDRFMPKDFAISHTALMVIDGIRPEFFSALNEHQHR